MRSILSQTPTRRPNSPAFNSPSRGHDGVYYYSVVLSISARACKPTLCLLVAFVHIALNLGLNCVVRVTSGCLFYCFIVSSFIFYISSFILTWYRERGRKCKAPHSTAHGGGWSRQRRQGARGNLHGQERRRALFVGKKGLDRSFDFLLPRKFHMANSFLFRYSSFIFVFVFVLTRAGCDVAYEAE